MTKSPASMRKTVGSATRSAQVRDFVSIPCGHEPINSAGKGSRVRKGEEFACVEAEGRRSRAAHIQSKSAGLCSGSRSQFVADLEMTSGA